MTLAIRTAVKLTLSESRTICASCASPSAISRADSLRAVAISIMSSRRPGQQISDLCDFPGTVELVSRHRPHQVEVFRPLQQPYQFLHRRLPQRFHLADEHVALFHHGQE